MDSFLAVGLIVGAFLVIGIVRALTWETPSRNVPLRSGAFRSRPSEDSAGIDTADDAGGS